MEKIEGGYMEQRLLELLWVMERLLVCTDLIWRGRFAVCPLLCCKELETSEYLALVSE